MKGLLVGRFGRDRGSSLQPDQHEQVGRQQTNNEREEPTGASSAAAISKT